MFNSELIKAGQGSRIAFLEDADANAVAETLVAFANTEGGTIVIGLKTDGQPSDKKLTAERVQKAIQDADDLYNPPVVMDKWQEVRLSEAMLSADSADDNANKDDDGGDTGEDITRKDVPLTKKDEEGDGDKKADGKASDNGASEADEGVITATVGDDKADDKADAKPDGEPLLSKPKAEQDNGRDDVALNPDEEATFTVYALRVPRSIELHALSDGRVLIRSGAKNRPLGGQEILRLASAKNTGDFEAEIVHGCTKDDFSRKMIDEYLEKRAERTKRPYNGKIDDLLVEIGAITPDGKPTVTGILLFSDYPQQWLPQSSVVFAKFVGTTPRGESGLAGYTRREELTGPLPRLIEATWNIIWSEMAVSAVVKGLEREERTEYPQFAVREAIVNSICHRDYRLRGRRIEVRMYSDRLEVISPGGLPGFITVENIKDEHFSRNPRIVNGLFQWGYIEELGLGIDRMMEVMEQAGHRPPTFDARPYSFAVTLYNEREKPKAPEWVRNTNHRQARALQYIREHGSITNREYRSLCQGVSAETLRLDLVDMVDKAILIKVGSKKGTHYILK